MLPHAKQSQRVSRACVVCFCGVLRDERGTSAQFKRENSFSAEKQSLNTVLKIFLNIVISVAHQEIEGR